MKQGIYKVPGGKLIKILLDEHDGKVSSVKITGDFFMHPEESIDNMEAALKGIPIDKEKIIARLNDFLLDNKVTLLGADSESLAHTIINSK